MSQTETAIAPVRRGSANQWADEETSELAIESLQAMHEVFIDHDIEMVIPPELALGVIVAVTDRRIRDSLVPGVLELIRSNVRALPGLDDCELDRLDKLIVAGGRRRA